MLRGEPAADVAERPAEATEHGEHHRDQRTQPERAAGGAVDPDDRHAEHRHHDAHHLEQGHALAQEQHSEQHGERSRRLQHQRRESGWHPQMHRQEQEGELDEAESGGVQQKPPQAHVREGDERDDRDGHHREAQRCAEKRREVVEAEADRNEVQSPQRHHCKPEKPVAVGHDDHRGDEFDQGQSNCCALMM